MKRVWVNGISAFSMVVFMIFLVVNRYVLEEGKLKSNHRVTVGLVYKTSFPAEGGMVADFQYCVNKVIYKNFTSLNPEQQKIEIEKNFC